MRPIAFRTVLIAAGLCLAWAARAGAQLTVTQASGCSAALASPTDSARGGAAATSTTQPPSDTAARGASETGQPDVLLLVAFSADELRFNGKPDARIRFCWGGDSLHVVERRNLPSPVVAGTTYRNVFIAAELRAYLNADCLSQRLGVASSTTSTTDSACATIGLTPSGGMAKAKPASDTTPVSGRVR